MARTSFRIALYLVILSLPLLPGSPRAQSYPVKPIRIITPFPTGLGPEVALRIVTDRLGRTWNQPFIVDARPGANGFIAINEAKNVVADGYALLQAGQAQLVLNPLIFKKAGYDSQQDFIPISTIFSAPFFIAVASKGPYGTIRELVAAARANPGKLSYSSPYVGSPGHLGTELFLRQISSQMLHVPFKEAAQVYASVANGNVDWSMGSIGSTLPLVRGGRIKLIAVAAKSRHADFPDIPTVEEAGGPAGYQVDVWGGVVAPRGTPRDIVGRLSAGFAETLAHPEVQAQFRKIGLEPVSSTSEAMAERIRVELGTYGDLVARIGLSVE